MGMLYKMKTQVQSQKAVMHCQDAWLKKVKLHPKAI